MDGGQSSGVAPADDDGAGQPRSLAEALSRMSDQELMTLFEERPDLVRQLPEDLTGLAARCASPWSMRLVWDRLTALEQQVVEVLLAHQAPISFDTLLLAMAPEIDRSSAVYRSIQDALSRCRALAVIWGEDEALRALTSANTLVGPFPCGLDPADRSHLIRISHYRTDPSTLFDELETAPPAARAALNQLLWGPPRGSLPNADRAVSAASANTPVEWLLARDILVASGPDSVALPREVALLLRRGRYVQQVASPPDPPALPDAPAVADADATGGMRALELTRTVGQLLALLEEGKTRLLRSGGMYQRDAADLGRRLRLTLPETALIADVAFAAGLIAADLAAGVWGLTRTADAWRALSEQRQWTALALAWRDSSSRATQAGAATDTENRILSDGLHEPSIAEIRRLVLQAATSVPHGAPLDLQRLVRAVGWLRPRLHGRDLPDFVAEILTDGEFLGVFGRGVLTSAGRRLAIGAEPASIAGALVWPALVDQVILQADATATALGPLTLEAEARVRLLADLESSGAGTVYRIGATSLTRAFDAGMATAEVLAELVDLSATGVPSTLETLVGDVGRRHGSVRVLAAASVVTTDDEAALAAAMADRTLAHLRLHRIAAGVAVSPVAPGEVTAALRKAGVAAVSAQPSAGGGRARRLPAPRPFLSEPIDADLLSTAVRAVRAGESARAALTGTDRVTAVGPHELVATLTEAIREGRNVWLDYSDPTGTRRVRLVEPLTVRNGLLSGFDHRDQRVSAFPLSRIAGISAVKIPDSQ